MVPRRILSRERSFLLLLLLGGLAIRLIWLASIPGGAAAFFGAGEATRVALALARTGSFADSFYQGYGPTAHLLPVSPAIAGALLWLFGPGAPAANLALLVWTLAQGCCAILLLRRLFQKLGADPVAIRWGTGLLCLATPFLPQDLVDFRYWEGASAVCLMCVNLLFLLHLEDRGAASWRQIAAIAGLSAATFFVSPPVGLAVDACWAVFALRRLPPPRAAGLAAASALALALLLGPWALRNTQALGAPVLLRSNFGLELALANHPTALSAKPPEQVFAERLLEIHPYHSPRARAVLHDLGGEAAYAQALGDQTRAWIAANPAGFVRLYLRHLGQFLFPRPWQMYFTGWEGMRSTRAVAVSLVDLLGLLGLAIGLWRRRPGYWMLGLYALLVALPYGLVQPIPRYTYLVYGMFAFLAADLVVRGLRYGRVNEPGWAR